MAIRIISLLAKLGIDGSGYQRGLQDAQRQTEVFGSNIKSRLASMFGATAMIAFARGAIQVAANIKDMAEQFSLSTDEVQRLELAFQKSGMAFEDAGKAVQKLNTLRQKAIDGDEEAIRSARRLGLAMEDIFNQDVGPVALLEKIGAALQGVKLDVATATALREIFGERKGTRILQALRDISETKVPPLFTPETISVMDQLEIKSLRFWKHLQAAAADSIAGWATFLGIVKPEIDRKEPSGFESTSDEDLREHIRLLQAAQTEREKIVGGTLKSGTPEYGRRAMTLLGVNPDLAMSFKEDEAMLAGALAELQRRQDSNLGNKGVFLSDIINKSRGQGGGAIDQRPGFLTGMSPTAMGTALSKSQKSEELQGEIARNSARQLEVLSQINNKVQRSTGKGPFGSE